jgi:hypothetical protein
MTRTALTIAVAFVCGTAIATPPPVTVISPCECRDNHGKGRCAVKNDPATLPTDANAIQSVTPSQMYAWPGTDADLTCDQSVPELKIIGTRSLAVLLL